MENASADPPDSPTNRVCSVSSITALATPMAFLILRRLATAPTSIVSLVKGKYALLLNRERESYGVWDSPWSKGDVGFMNTSHACMFTYVSCIFLRYGKHIPVYFNAHNIGSNGKPQPCPHIPNANVAFSSIPWINIWSVINTNSFLGS